MILGLLIVLSLSTVNAVNFWSAYLLEEDVSVPLQSSGFEQQCKFFIKMGSKKAHIKFTCSSNSTRIEQTYGISQKISSESYNTHKYFIYTLPNHTSIGTFNLSSNTSTTWSYSLNLQNYQNTITLTGNIADGNELVVYTIFLYSILSLLIMPPSYQYYSKMASFHPLIMLCSQLLNISVLGSTAILYFYYVVEGVQWLQIVVNFINTCVVFLQLLAKNRALVMYVYRKFGNSRSQYIFLVLFWIVLVVSSLYYYQLHKDGTTFTLFSAFLILYMSSFLFKSLKPSIFCFRAVLLDSCTIVLLSVLSRIYPVFNYQPSTYLNVVSSLLIFTVLQIYSIGIYILLKVKKDAIDQIGNQSRVNIQIQMKQNIGSQSRKMMKEQTNADNKDQWNLIHQSPIKSQVASIQFMNPISGRLQL